MMKWHYKVIPFVIVAIGVWVNQSESLTFLSWQTFGWFLIWLGWFLLDHLWSRHYKRLKEQKPMSIKVNWANLPPLGSWPPPFPPERCSDDLEKQVTTKIMDDMRAALSRVRRRL